MSTDLYPRTEPGDEIDLANPPMHCYEPMALTSTEGDYGLVADPDGLVFTMGRKRRPRGGPR